MNNYSKILYKILKKFYEKYEIFAINFWNGQGLLQQFLYSLFVALNIGIEFLGFCLYTCYQLF